MTDPNDLPLTELLALARPFILGFPDGEDLYQDVVLKLLAKDPGSWWHAHDVSIIRTIARRTAIDRYRRASKREVSQFLGDSIDTIATPRHDDPVKACLKGEQVSQVRHAIDRLDEPYRSTTIAVYFHDLSPQQIARNDCISVETVRTRLRRAKEKLRGLLRTVEFREI